MASKKEPVAPATQPGSHAAKKQEHRDEVMARVHGHGRFQRDDIDELRQDHDDDEIAQTLAEYLATPAGQVEMAKAGKGGADPQELARDVMRGR